MAEVRFDSVVGVGLSMSSAPTWLVSFVVLSFYFFFPVSFPKSCVSFIFLYLVFQKVLTYSFFPLYVCISQTAEGGKGEERGTSRRIIVMAVFFSFN